VDFNGPWETESVGLFAQAVIATGNADMKTATAKSGRCTYVVLAANGSRCWRSTLWFPFSQEATQGSRLMIRQ
jgi:hypothetical protein